MRHQIHEHVYEVGIEYEQAARSHTVGSGAVFCSKDLTAEVQALALLGGIGELIIGALVVTGDGSFLIGGTGVVFAVGDLAVQYNMPLRGLAQMTNGMIGDEFVDGLVLEAKGFWVIGILRALVGLLQNFVANSRYQAKLDEQSR